MKIANILAFLTSFVPGFAHADIDLSRWNVTLPVDKNGGTTGEAVEVPALGHVAIHADGSISFKADVAGAHTSGSKYPRDELREISAPGKLAAWKAADGFTMTATLSMDAIPMLKDGTVGKAEIGQIHGKSNEMIRLYWDKGTIYYHNDISGSDHKEHEFLLKDAAGKSPDVSLGEKFSYKIDEHENILSVFVYAVDDIYSLALPLDTKWASDTLYGKAGLYLGENASQGATGYGQDTFYALDYSHVAGQGLGGLPAPSTPPAPVVIAGKALADQLRVLADQVEVLK